MKFNRYLITGSGKLYYRNFEAITVLPYIHIVYAGANCGDNVIIYTFLCLILKPDHYNESYMSFL